MNDERQILEQEFKKFDLDGNGFITSDEIKIVLGKYASEEQINEFLKGMDQNEDGKISIEECLNYYLSE